MATKNGGFGGELSYNFAQTVKHVGIAAALEIGAAYAHAEQGVARESYFLFGAIEGYTAGSMTGSGQNLQTVRPKSDNLVLSKETAWSRILAAEFYARHNLELIGNIGDEPLVFGSNLGLKPPGIEHGVDAEVMVEMTMGAQKVYGFEIICVYIIYKCLALSIVVSAAIYDYTLAGFIANHVGVLLKEIETESLDVKHYSGR